MMILSIDYVRISCSIRSIMSDYNYETIKASVMQWYEKVLSESRNKIENEK